VVVHTPYKLSGYDVFNVGTNDWCMKHAFSEEEIAVPVLQRSIFRRRNKYA
jgi:hypothetical protein